MAADRDMRGEASGGAMFASCRAAALYWASLVLLPVTISFLTPLICTILARPAHQRSAWYQMIGAGVKKSVKAIGECGVAGAWIVVVSHLCAFGIPIVCCIIASRWWNPKRVYCLMAGALLPHCVLFGAHLYRAWRPSAAYPFELGSLWWQEWLGSSSTLVFVGLAVGWAASLLPIFRPGVRYWLARGMCPKCHYDLRGKIEDGCPECGWSRGQEQRLLQGTPGPASNIVAASGDPGPLEE